MLFVTAPILCYVTDRKLLAGSEGGAGPEVLRKISEAIAADVDGVQIREKDMPVGELLKLAQEAVRASAGERFRDARTKIIVNDRLDVAIAASAAGVHLGRESAPVSEVVRWCRKGNAPREFMVGVSCHGLAEARDAESAGASYVILGPIFDTPSKRAFGEPMGIAQLSVVCAALKIPVLAIGGVDARNARECLRAGAAGIAAIRMFQDSRNADELKSRIESLRRDPGIVSKR
jgi:thiamine-phosphate pyrophosphorylase